MRPLFHNWKDIYSTCNFMLFTNHKDALAVDVIAPEYGGVGVGSMINVQVNGDTMS